VEGSNFLSPPVLCSVFFLFVSLLYHYPSHPTSNMSLSPGDPSSHSRPDLAVVTNIHLDLEVDFDRSVLTGTTLLTIQRVVDDAKTVILDVNKLDIHNVKDETTGQILEYTYGEAGNCGSKLEITLPEGNAKEMKLSVNYTTSPESSALQWLSPEQTAGKVLPYVFSQCEAIHCRSMLPCQDTPSVKAPYTAEITAPPGITVLMSAVPNGGPKEADNGKKKFSFSQKIPVQSYLIAIAAGAIESRKIGPRSHVWSEKEYVDKAAFDFSETETMLATAEDLCGPYVWGIYDILVLPPSFPFGGMENPCLTFATPTLLSGDKSNADVIAHEIAHSWTGNLVTNQNFEHFWLNEGFTVFTERKIKGRLEGEPTRHFSAIGGWNSLEETIEKVLGPTNPFTALVVDLAGVDPDDAFSVVPYEKGSTFLWYLEDLVGGPDQMEPFLKSYYKEFAYKSIDSDTFKKFFLDYFKDTESVKDIDWATWLKSPGMPIYKPKFDQSLAQASWDLAEKWTSWDETAAPSPFDGSEMKTFSAGQKQEFLTTLTNGKEISTTKLEKMEELYKLNESGNVEIQFRWIRLGIKARWETIVQPALALVNSQGRMKFVRPVYRDLYAWEEKRKLAVDNFLENRKYMMHVSAEMVAKDLKIDI